MAEIQKEYQDWAARKAGDGESDEGGNAGGEGAAAEGEEPPPPAHECLSHAAQEITEAIEMLEKAKGQVEDPDEIQADIDALTEQQLKLTEKATELEEASKEDEGESEDEQEDPETETEAE